MDVQMRLLVTDPVTAGNVTLVFPALLALGTAFLRGSSRRRLSPRPQICRIHLVPRTTAPGATATAHDQRRGASTRNTDGRIN